jgi:hypothetical protein
VKIGRDDIAQKLYTRARPYLDAAEDVKLLARCEA